MQRLITISNKVRLLTAGLAFLTVSSAFSQDWPFQLWHEGKIVLLEGDTLRGLVKYDLQQDLLQYTPDNQKVEAFSARKVLLFEIFDKTVHKYRQFFALPYASAAATYRAPVFFELLEEGKMTLLAREGLEYQSMSSPYYVGTYTRLVLKYKYFFLEETGNITEFVGNKNDLLDLMGKKSEDVEKYIKANRLKVDDKYDFAKIIAYYNSFFGT